MANQFDEPTGSTTERCETILNLGVMASLRLPPLSCTTSQAQDRLNSVHSDSDMHAGSAGRTPMMMLDVRTGLMQARAWALMARQTTATCDAHAKC